MVTGMKFPPMSLQPKADAKFSMTEASSGAHFELQRLMQLLHAEGAGFGSCHDDSQANDLQSSIPPMNDWRNYNQDHMNFPPDHDEAVGGVYPGARDIGRFNNNCAGAHAESWFPVTADETGVFRDSNQQVIQSSAFMSDDLAASEGLMEYVCDSSALAISGSYDGQGRHRCSSSAETDDEHVWALIGDQQTVRAQEMEQRPEAETWFELPNAGNTTSDRACASSFPLYSPAPCPTRTDSIPVAHMASPPLEREQAAAPAFQADDSAKVHKARLNLDYGATLQLWRNGTEDAAQFSDPESEVEASTFVWPSAKPEPKPKSPSSSREPLRSSTSSEVVDTRTRQQKLDRYREKKANRKRPGVLYQLRKANADKRPRFKGRFVKKGEVVPAAALAAAPAPSAE